MLQCESLVYKLSGLHFIISLILLYLPSLNAACTTPTPYDLDGTCYAVCPWVAPNQYYGDINSGLCVTTCTSPYYAFDTNKTCIATCPSASIQTYYDDVNRRCVYTCPANYFGYTNQSCLANCPSGTFSDFITSLCVTTCPVGTYYMNGTKPNCTKRCPNNYYANPINLQCVVGGSCPTTPIKYFADDTTNLCVRECSKNYFADTTTGRCLIFCSVGFFGDSSTGTGVCVANCTPGLYRDNVTRKCVLNCPQGYYIDLDSLNCTATCPNNYYGDSVSKKCVTKCPTTTFGDSASHLCVAACPFGKYADNYTQICVDPDKCYANTVGDPTTNKCVNISSCPSAPYYYADLVSKLCVLVCSSSPSLFGDKTTKMCVSQCPWNAPSYISYSDASTRTCVTQCPSNPMLYASNLTKSCVPTCPQPPSVTYSTYADPTTQQCVQTCPNGFKTQGTPDFTCVSQCASQSSTLFYYSGNQSCISACPAGYFADTSKAVCTKTCPTSPNFFGYSLNNTCLATCPQGYFADSSTQLCVQSCPETTSTYADPSTNTCVEKCPVVPDLYGQNLNDGNRTCVETCDLGYFAEPLTRKCVQKCNVNLGFYGQSGRCVIKCSLDTLFADNITGTCVTNCPKTPQTYFGNVGTRQCVLTCPNFLYGNAVQGRCVEATSCQAGYYADDSTNMCVNLCPISQSTFGQSLTKRCIKSCPEGQFADNTTRLCSGSCAVNSKLYKDPVSKSCVASCPSNPVLYADPNTMICSQRCTLDYFALDLNQQCVSICPSTPSYYGDLNTKRCVLNCPRQYFRFYNNTFRGCLASCPPRVYTAGNSVDLYADNSTWTCVTQCPPSENLYNFRHPTNDTLRICVLTCPMVGSAYYFADNFTRTCVTSCPTATQSTYGDVFTSRCEINCTRNQYRDIVTGMCTYSCSNGYFADNTTWDCVKICPLGYFAETTNKTCRKDCPFNTYAQQFNRTCASDCSIRGYLYSNNMTHKCVRSCPQIPNMFANPDNKQCNYFCTNGKFGDSYSGTCVTADKCALNDQIAQITIGRCVDICPIAIPSFKHPINNTCVITCPDGYYADNSTMECVTKCPISPDFYAYNHTTLGPICVLYCPAGYYRHTPTRQCLLNCPSPTYFKNTLTMTCVLNCPDHFYKDTIGQICVSDCKALTPQINGLQNNWTCVANCPGVLFRHPVTFICVDVCPQEYYGEDNLCKSTCTSGFADPVTKICEQNCSLGYFAKLPQRVCLLFCNSSQYALLPNRTCVAQCPTSSNQSLNMYFQTNSKTCVHKCLVGWYADNSTRQCQSVCSDGYFADNASRLCVPKCSESFDLYGHNKICYKICPGTNFAQNFTRTCMPVCPSGSFADQRNKRCMDICSGVQYGYLNLTDSSRICVFQCPTGYFGYWTNKTCLQSCPDGFFGENATHMCVATCPSGSYGDDTIHSCVVNCTITVNTYADPSTNKCVPECPSIPSLYAQDSDRTCVLACSGGLYRLNTTRKCVSQLSCPSPLYSDPSNGYCVYKCSINYNRYADDLTRKCVEDCPNYTDPNNASRTIITFADDSTKRCVLKCPKFPSLYGCNATNKCVALCNSTLCPISFGDNETRLCLSECFFGVEIVQNTSITYTYADQALHYCVMKCSRNSFADNKTAKCAPTCTEGSFADNSTWRCVAVCPASPLSFAYIPTKQCLYACPAPYFADSDGLQCNLGCPKLPIYYYKDSQSRRCVLNCIYPYFADPISQTCSIACQYGYFQNIAEAKCQKCPSTCLSCITELNCTSCAPGIYFLDGACVSSCPIYPLLYFADDLTFSCVTTCIAPYFGFIPTGKCELGCPQTYYSDPVTSSCLSCPTGCLYCFNTNCSSCLQGYVYSQVTATCTKACSTINTFFNLDGTCVASCPAGTFLLSDLVTCQACSKDCLTCQSIGTNCTACFNKFWYNYMCVTTCPQKYYADSNNKCQSCGSNNQNCLLPPLSYTVSTFTQNYQLFAKVEFNRAVSLTQSQFTQYIQIKSVNKAIKPNEFTVSRQTPTEYLVAFINSASLNEMSLSFGFLPGTVADNSGNALATSDVSVQVSTLTTVSVETQAKAVAMSNQVSVVSWILISLVFLMMIRFSYPILIFVDTLQILYMHVYITIAPMPYTWFKLTYIFGYFTFNFLPKIYETNTTTTPYIQPYNSFELDTTLLGNLQPFIFFVSIFCGIYLIVWLLSLKIFNRSDKFREKVKELYKSRFKYSILFEAFYLTILYTLFHSFYQFKGYNNEVRLAGANKALAVLCTIAYIVFLGLIAYASYKTRNKITDVPDRILKRMPLPKMPSKFKFLIYQPSQFPMQILIRTFIKICICASLQIQSSQVQLILMISFNLIFLLYILMFKPSLYKLTNRLNIILTLGFLALEVMMFSYSLSEKSTAQQDTTSIILFAIEWAMIGLILVWMVYRFLIYIAQRWFNKTYPYEFQIQPKKSKKHYGKIKEDSVRDITASFKKNKLELDGEVNDINVSELNIEDEEDQEQTVNPDNLIKEFAYHMIPKKTQQQIKAEQKILGVKSAHKKKFDPIVIQIDQDQLIGNEKAGINNTRGARTGNLQIPANDQQSLDNFDFSMGSRSKYQKRKKADNEVIWSNLDMQNSDQQSQL